MYYYIKGKLVLRQESFVVLDCGGVGYKLYTSETTKNALKEGADATLYTYLHVREDVFDLYGFFSHDELNMFLQLLSVSGVGPKAALAILSVMTPNAVALAVITNDAKALTKAAGVGAKMAQRIILELKDKLKKAEILPENIAEEVSINDTQSEAVSALMVLGYSQSDAKSAVAKTDASLPTEEIVKLALKKLMR
ncbi:MAG: Holliday junction branch migration protein RuvA [Clostridiales bacterium]|nr:Holliday junction branch migration protein RuvA [Clostridiales bacterium]